jgi:hypothetical protein
LEKWKTQHNYIKNLFQQKIKWNGEGLGNEKVMNIFILFLFFKKEEELKRRRFG